MKKVIFFILAIALVFTMGCMSHKSEQPSSEEPSQDVDNYNASAARADIKKGEIWLLYVGFPAQPDARIDSIRLKYGFRSASVGCAADDIEGLQNYNDVMMAWLNKRNGDDWQQRYNKEVEELRAKQ